MIINSRYIKYFIFFTFIFSFSSIGDIYANSENTKSNSKVAYKIDFSDYSKGSIDEWLLSKGFVLAKDANDREMLDLDIGSNRLRLNIKNKSFGLIINEKVDVINYDKIRIEWGVNKFPGKAAYSKGVYNEALMLYIFFGKEKMESGSMLIPNSPYFIGFYLCDNDQVNVPYFGKYFKVGGRYVCVNKPEKEKVVVTELNLKEWFIKLYKGNVSPIITGISLGFDTRFAEENGIASAFIKKIEFLKN